ncbi:transposase [Bacillus mangrovi]|uniref:Transposase n=1 Tax=Metabacillus mangrovi TaxID=1491830 RepID=A0A7X2V503_9BACI|nr:transposase [Metabacillus mangrovi]MTH53955.1 transposase [Metabacillus mangrovi]
MPRKLRDWKENTIYHITARGNRRMEIFHYKQDREKYLELLGEVCTLYPFKLHAYCLMSNHIHLLLETESVPLSSIIRVLHSRYAVFINHRHKYEGHLFQGRFAASEIRDDYQFKDTSRYIHLNPVKSSIVLHPSEYLWSSYESYIRNRPNPYITKEKHFSLFPKPFEKNYQKFVEIRKPQSATSD